MVLFLNLLGRLPLPLLHLLGGGLGMLTYVLSPRYRRHLVANLQQAGLAANLRFKVARETGKQMLEMFIVLFYLVYCVEFLYRYIKQKPNGRSRWNQAYRAISFEREAYFNESRPNYFALREPYQWVTYM